MTSRWVAVDMEKASAAAAPECRRAGGAGRVPAHTCRSRVHFPPLSPRVPHQHVHFLSRTPLENRSHQIRDMKLCFLLHSHLSLLYIRIALSTSDRPFRCELDSYFNLFG